MAIVSVEVPGLARLVRETVVLLYRATAEALHLALAAQAEGAEGLGEVAGSRDEAGRHRARLKQLDVLLGQLDAPGDPGRTAVELSAPPGLLRDVLYGALIDAGERLAVACTSSWRDESRAEGVRSAASEVIALDALLRRLEAS